MNDIQKRDSSSLDTGTTSAEGFGSTALTRTAETASAAAAAQAQAIVQARFIIAARAPRDLDAVRLKLLKECKRPGFADVARYHKPIGRGVEGPSIRFAEAAARCMGNIENNAQSIYDSPEKRIVRVAVTDLESNVGYSGDITIDKTVERSKVPSGMMPISTRTNANGGVTYILPATDDDLKNKENALVSKMLRTLILRVVPGDIIDECMAIVVRVQGERDAKDPDEARKKLVEAFAGIGVKPGDLKEYLGHDLDVIAPAELLLLRALFAAIRDGEANWKDALETKKKGGAIGGEKPADLKERVAQKARAANGKPAEKHVEPPRPEVVDTVADVSDADESYTGGAS